MSYRLTVAQHDNCVKFRLSDIEAGEAEKAPGRTMQLEVRSSFQTIFFHAATGCSSRRLVSLSTRIPTHARRGVYPFHVVTDERGHRSAGLSASAFSDAL